MAPQIPTTTSRSNRAATDLAGQGHELTAAAAGAASVGGNGFPTGNGVIAAAVAMSPRKTAKRMPRDRGGLMRRSGVFLCGELV